MIGTLQMKNGTVIGKCGFKVLKLVNGIEVKEDGCFTCNGKLYHVGEDLMAIDFEESSVVKETMSTLVVENCAVLEECASLLDKKSQFVHDMNIKHMRRFAHNYGEAFKDNYDLTKFKTMDVIDLRNINSIQFSDGNETTEDTDELRNHIVFRIEDNGKAHKVTTGMDLDHFTGDNDFLYMVIPNSWHRIQRNDEGTRLVIDVTERAPKNDLLFVKFCRESLTAYLGSH